MLKSYKTEIAPTPEQKVKIKKTIGVSRYIYNFYIEHNKELYENGEKFMTAYDFSKWLNNEYIPNNPEKFWIKELVVKQQSNQYLMHIQHSIDFLISKPISQDLKRKIKTRQKCILSRLIKKQ